MDKTNMVSV